MADRIQGTHRNNMRSHSENWPPTVRAKLQASRGEFGAHLAPGEQGTADFVLQRLDAHGHGRLGNIQTFGCLIEIAGFGNLQKCTREIDIHGAARSQKDSIYLPVLDQMHRNINRSE
jgi:hypothetical protein